MPRAGRKLGALYKKPIAIPKVRLTPFHAASVPLCAVTPRTQHQTLTSCHARRLEVGLFVEPGERDEEGPCHLSGQGKADYVIRGGEQFGYVLHGRCVRDCPLM